MRHMAVQNSTPPTGVSSSGTRLPGSPAPRLPGSPAGQTRQAHADGSLLGAARRPGRRRAAACVSLQVPGGGTPRGRPARSARRRRPQRGGRCPPGALNGRRRGGSCGDRVGGRLRKPPPSLQPAPGGSALGRACVSEPAGGEKRPTAGRGSLPLAPTTDSSGSPSSLWEEGAGLPVFPLSDFRRLPGRLCREPIAGHYCQKTASRDWYSKTHVEFPIFAVAPNG